MIRGGARAPGGGVGSQDAAYSLRPCRERHRECCADLSGGRIPRCLLVENVACRSFFDNRRTHVCFKLRGG